MRQIRPTLNGHKKYSDCPKKQKAMEDGIDAMCASILDLVAVVIHQRLTQFGEMLAEEFERKGAPDER